eukprot:COSAG06_NODE_417_length_15986_cov_832.025493_8_plen_90_part_00
MTMMMVMMMMMMMMMMMTTMTMMMMMMYVYIYKPQIVQTTNNNKSINSSKCGLVAHQLRPRRYSLQSATSSDGGSPAGASSTPRKPSLS